MKKNKWISFLFGDISSTAFFLLYADFHTEIIKIASAVVIGIIGGAAGLLGKDLYTITKSFTNKKKSIMKSWILKNKVFVSGFLMSITLVLQQALANHTADLKALGFALLIGVLGYVGNQWKNAGLSVTGIIGTVAFTFVNINATGKFTWWEFIATSLLAIITVAAGSLAQPQTAPGLPYQKS